MIRTALAFTIALAAALPAFAANEQVDSDTYRKGQARDPFYGRSDGLYYHKSTKIPVFVGNGTGLHPLGPTYREDFGYGDGLGAICSSVFAPGDAGFTVAQGAGTACDTTCGQAACVAGLDTDGNANGADFELCDEATADSCICMNAGLDLYGVCGADWEAPALGLTLMEFGSGVRLIDVALLEQLIGPDMDAAGLDIGQDQTDNDGVEVLGGMYGASGRPMFPGTDPAFFFCAEVTIADISGTDDFWVGWRDTTAPNATFNNYNSYFAAGLDNATGDFHTEHEDDGSGLDTDDIAVSAIADGGTVKICAFVGDTGAATCTVEGEECGDTDYTFDSGEGIIPFVHYLHATTSPGAIHISDWAVGYGTEAELRAAGVLQ